MPKFTVTFEDVAFSSRGPEDDPIELSLSEHELRGFNEVRISEGEFPSGVLGVTRCYATPDTSVFEHGRDGGYAKLFASIDLLVEADSLEDARGMNPPARLLAEMVDMLDEHLELEGSWEIVGTARRDEYLIRHVDDAGLFWCRSGGWGEMDLAASFVEDQKADLELPSGGEWVQLDDYAPAPSPTPAMM